LYLGASLGISREAEEVVLMMTAACQTHVNKIGCCGEGFSD
jgi:hypothetical protein